MATDYSKYIFKTPGSTGYYSIVGGTARQIANSAQEVEQNLGIDPTKIQTKDWGVDTAGYTPQHGGGTTGGAWDINNLKSTVYGMELQNAPVVEPPPQVQAPAQQAAPTQFQTYFQSELGKGRSAQDILSNNPFMAGGTQGPAQTQPAAVQQPVQAAAAPIQPSYTGSSVVDFLKSSGQSSDFSSRTKLAQQYGIANYTGTANQNLQLLGLLQKQVPTIQNKPAASGNIQATDMGTGAGNINQVQNNIERVNQNFPNTPQGQAAQNQSDLDYITTIIQKATPAEQTQQAGIDRLKQLAVQSTEADKARAAAEIQATAAIDKQVADLNIQMAQMKNGIAAMSNQAIPSTFIVGQQREQLVNLANLATMSLALQGNRAAAIEMADRANIMQYGDVEKDIKNQQAILDANSPFFNAQEKKQADIVKVLLDERQRIIDDAKTQKDEINKVMISAAENGADTATLQKISKSTSTGQAIQNAGSFLQKPESGKFSTYTSGYDENGNPIIKILNQQTGQTLIPGASTLGDQQGIAHGLPTYDTRAANPGMNRSDRNNNPGNIKVSSATATYPGVIGVESTPAADGGNFLIFDNAQSGIAAIGKLLQVGSAYQGVTAEQAIKKYNGGGAYGAASLGLNPNQDFQSQIKDPTKLSAVATAIAKAEGFTGATPDVSTNPQQDGIAGWVDQINSGKATIANVPDKLKTQVVSALSKVPAPTDTALETQAKNKISLIDEILASPGLSGAVGPTFFSRLNPIAGLTGATANFVASVQQLTNQETLDSLLKLKKAGGTLGALNENEGQMLRDAATKINNWAKTDWISGKVDGYVVDEKSFRTELNRIKELAQKAVLSSTSPEIQTMTDGTKWTQNSDGSFTQLK